MPMTAESGLASNLRMDKDIGLRTDCGYCKMTTTLGTAAKVYGKNDDPRRRRTDSEKNLRRMAQAKQSQEKANRARILLVDHHAVVRYGIAQLINRQTDLVVCGEEEDGSKAMTAIAGLKPTLVIADISLKDSSGLELMRNIKAQYPGLPVLVVSVHDESIYAEIAFRAGALGYLMKEEALEKILTAIRRVLTGAIYVSDRLAAKMLQQQVRGQTPIQESPVKGLSDRELEGFQLIGQWKKTREIADELHLSIKTIEYYG